MSHPDLSAQMAPAMMAKVQMGKAKVCGRLS
jgi:hypothetical protein